MLFPILYRNVCWRGLKCKRKTMCMMKPHLLWVSCVCQAAMGVLREQSLSFHMVGHKIRFLHGTGSLHQSWPNSRWNLNSWGWCVLWDYTHTHTHHRHTHTYIYTAPSCSHHVSLYQMDVKVTMSVSVRLKPERCFFSSSGWTLMNITVSLWHSSTSTSSRVRSYDIFVRFDSNLTQTHCYRDVGKLCPVCD